MKGMLQKLTKEREEKEVCIKFQQEEIAKLTRKLEKWPSQFFTKGSESEGKEKVSIHCEAFNEEVQSKKGYNIKNYQSQGSMIVEQIQDLIANAVIAQVRGGVRITHMYTKPQNKRIDALCTLSD